MAEIPRIRIDVDTVPLKDLLAQLKLLETSERQGALAAGTYARAHKDIEERIGKLTLNLAQHTQAQAALYQSQQRVSVGFKGMATSLNDMSTNLRSRATPAAVSFAQVIQDMPYGIRGIGNNIEYLTQQLILLRTQAGSTGGALSAIWRAIKGPMGILMGVSIVTSLATWLQMYIEKANKATKETEDFGKKLDDIRIKANDAKAALDKMFPGAGDFEKQNKAYKDALQAELDIIREKKKELSAKHGEGVEYQLGIKTPYGQLVDQENQILRLMKEENIALKERAELIKFIRSLAGTGKIENIHQLLVSGGYSLNDLRGVQGALEAQVNRSKLGTQAWKDYSAALKEVNSVLADFKEKTDDGTKAFLAGIAVRNKEQEVEERGTALSRAIIKAGFIPKRVWPEEVKGVKEGMGKVGYKTAGNYLSALMISEELERDKEKVQSLTHFMISGFREATNVLAEGIRKSLDIGTGLGGALISVILGVGTTLLGAQLTSWAFPSLGGITKVLGRAGGGWINEPVVGMGMMSRSIYTLAERGPEYVSSANRMGQSARYGGGTLSNPQFIIKNEIKAGKLATFVESGNRVNRQKRI